MKKISSRSLLAIGAGMLLLQHACFAFSAPSRLVTWASLVPSKAQGQKELTLGVPATLQLPERGEVAYVVRLKEGQYPLKMTVKGPRGSDSTLLFDLSLRTATGQRYKQIEYVNEVGESYKSEKVITLTEDFEGLLVFTQDRGDRAQIEFTLGSVTDAPNPPDDSNKPPKEDPFDRSKAQNSLLVYVHGISRNNQQAASDNEGIGTAQHPRYYWGWDLLAGSIGQEGSSTLDLLTTFKGGSPKASKTTRGSWSNYENYTPNPNESCPILLPQGTQIGQERPWLGAMVSFRDGSLALMPQVGAAIDQIYDSYFQTFGKLPADKQPKIVFVGHSFGGIVIRTILTNPTEGDFRGNKLTEVQREKATYIGKRVHFAASLSTPHLGSPLPLFSQHLEEAARAAFVIPGVANEISSAAGWNSETLNTVATEYRSTALNLIAGRRESLEDIIRMPNYNSGLLDPSKMRRPDGSQVLFYTMAGMSPGFVLYDTPKHITTAGIVWQATPQVSFGLQDLFGAGRFPKAAAALTVFNGALAVGGYGASPGKPWGAATVPAGDKTTKPDFGSNRFKVSGPEWEKASLSEQALIGAKQVRDSVGFVLRSMSYNSVYKQTPDGEYDNDGLVGWDSSNAIGLSGPFWKRVYGPDWGQVFPFDWDHHDSIDFNPGTGSFIYEYLVEDKLPSSYPSSLIAVEVDSVTSSCPDIDSVPSTNTEPDYRLEVSLSGDVKTFAGPDDTRTLTGPIRFESVQKGVLVPITIKLYDRDPISEDALSIGKEIGRDAIHLVYNRRTKRVLFVPSQIGTDPVIGMADDVITFAGHPTAKLPATISFKITEKAGSANVAQASSLKDATIRLFEKNGIIIALSNVNYSTGDPKEGDVLAGSGALSLTYPNPLKDYKNSQAAGLPDSLTAEIGRANFTGLVARKDGEIWRASGFGGILSDPKKVEDFAGSGAALELNKGAQMSLFKNSSGELQVNMKGGGSVTLPYRSNLGNPIKVSFAEIGIADVVNGPFEFRLREGALAGLASNEGIAVPLFRISAPKLDFDYRREANNQTRWELRVPNAKVIGGLPGLATKDPDPLEFDVNALRIDDDGLTSFSATRTFSAPRRVALVDPFDFAFAVKSATVEVRNNKLVSGTLLADIEFPDSVKSPTGGRASLNDVSITLGQGGVFVEAQKPLDVRWRGFALQAERFTLDLSADRSPGSMAPSWKGVSVPTGKLILPESLGDDAPSRTVTVSNFRLESAGISGSVTFGANGTAGPKEIAGFKASNVTGEIAFRQNAITKGGLSGELEIPSDTAGQAPWKFGAAASIDSNGLVEVGVKNTTFPLEGLGLNLQVESGTLSFGVGVPKVILSGKLAFANLPQAVASLNGKAIGVKGIGFDANGKFYAPTGGGLDLGEGAQLDLGPVMVDARSVALRGNAQGRLAAVAISGGVSIQGDLPVSGGVTFDGITIERASGTSPVPNVTIGGIGLEARMAGVGTIRGKISRQNVTGFTNAFQGNVDLNLDAFPGNIGVTLLLADDVWFVGGRVSGLNITTSPALTVYGFSGGFGSGIKPKPSQGRIEGLDQLERSKGSFFAQAGLLIGDPAQGTLWWGEVNLGVTLPQFILDIAGQATFVNLPGDQPSFNSRSWWENRSRVAWVFMRIDAEKKQFDLGGRLRFFFPSKSVSMFEAGGEFAMRLSPNEKFVRLGWEPAGQEKVFLKLNTGLGDSIGTFAAQVGLNIEFQETFVFQLDLNATLKMFSGAVVVSAGGTLNVYEWGPEKELGVNGSIFIEGMIDFGLFEAAAGGRLSMSWNEQRGVLVPAGMSIPVTTAPGGLRVRGTVYGRIGRLSGSKSITVWIIDPKRDN